MKSSYLLALFSYMIFTFSTRSMEPYPKEDNLEHYRPGSNLPTIELTSFPRPTSLKDGFQLCECLIKSTRGSWQEAQDLFVSENPKINIIVSLLNKNKMDISLRMNLFSNNEENFNLYNIFKSYSSIIESLKILQEIFNKINYSQHFNNIKDQISFINNTIFFLKQQVNEDEKSSLLKRALIQSPTLKSQGAMLQEQRGRFQAPITDTIAKYAFCDVEYVKEIFAPMLNEILRLTQKTLFQEAQHAKVQDADKAKPGKSNGARRKKNKNKIKNKNMAQAALLESESRKGIVLEEEKSLKDSLSACPEGEEKVNLQTDFREPKGDLNDDLNAVKNGIQILSGIDQQKHEDSFSNAEVFKISTETLITATVPKAEAIATISTSTSSKTVTGPLLTNATVEIPNSNQDYDLTPWKAYEQKLSIGEPNPEAGQDLTPILILSEECSFAARALLGLDKTTALDKVSMVIYIKMIKELGGSVIGHKKSTHFIARSLSTGLWHAVAMHRLHQDDPHIIPKNTRYWKIAKQLLIDIDLAEINLTI